MTRTDKIVAWLSIVIAMIVAFAGGIQLGAAVTLSVPGSYLANYKPLVGLVASSTISAGSGTAPVPSALPAPTPSIDDMRRQIVQLVNVERTKAGLQPLSETSLLNKSAELKAKDMAAKGYWSHYSPEGDSPWH